VHVAGLLLSALVLAARPPTTHDVAHYWVDERAAGGVYFPVSRGDLGRLGVFTAQRSIKDLLPGRLQDQVAGFRAYFSELEPNRSRLLLVHGRVRIYIVPTRGGAACFFLEPAGVGSCASSLLHGAWPYVDANREVWGLVGDEAVRVLVDRRPAVLGRNAFYLPLRRNEEAPHRLVVVDRGGARHVYTFQLCEIIDHPPFPPTPLDPGC
jgi:hypothetical protein